MKCPVCGKTVFSEKNSYEICPVCEWENDFIQDMDHTLPGGANILSVNEARIEYFLSGSSIYKEKALKLKNIFLEERKNIIKENDNTSSKLSELRENYINKLSDILNGTDEEI